MSEFHLLDEPNNADLAAKVTQAWRDFAQALGEALGGLPVDVAVYLTVDPTAYGAGEAVYSVMARRDEDRLLALAVGNQLLPADSRLDRAAVAAMVELGWSPPGVIAGSGEHFGITAEVGGAPQLAATITRTLRDIYGAPHPAFVVYGARDSEGETVAIPQLGTARHESTLLEADDEALHIEPDADPALLPEKVRTVLGALLKIEPDELPVDKDGDIGIRSGSAMVFVRVSVEPPLVDVLSPVLTEVEPSEALFTRLSELTNRMPIGRLYCVNGTVWASVPVMGRNFQPSHLMLAVQVMTGLADQLDDKLAGEFGGKKFFDGEKPPTPTEGVHTGMYL